MEGSRSTSPDRVDSSGMPGPAGRNQAQPRAAAAGASPRSAIATAPLSLNCTGPYRQKRICKNLVLTFGVLRRASAYFARSREKLPYDTRGFFRLQLVFRLHIFGENHDPLHWLDPYQLAEAHGHKTQLQPASTRDEVIASVLTHRSRKNRIPALAHSQEQYLNQE